MNMQPVNLEHYHLAQVNTAKIRYPLDDPKMADFVAQIRSINEIADTDPGFVWRLRGNGAEDATNIRAFDDENILITLTVWKSLEALSNYVYRSAHGDIMRSRRQWFEKSEQPILAMWWICAGYTPTVSEAKKRLEHLQRLGSTPYAFSFHKPFSPLDAIEYEQAAFVLT
jgi:Domain of unknown function (DUF3291)